MRLRLNSTLVVQPFDGDQRDMMLCELPRVRYCVPAAVVEFMRLFDGRRDTDEVIEHYLRASDGHYAKDALHRLIRGFLVPQALLVAVSADAGAPPAGAPRGRGYLFVRVPLLRAAWVSAAARPLTWLFRPSVVVAVLTAFAVVEIAAFAAVLRTTSFDLAALRGRDLVLLMLASTALGFLHEFGHATALARYGHASGDIGWGLYLWMRVLYTDLSAAWRLPRLQRAVVDLGGMYFSCLGLLATAMAFVATGHPLLPYVFFFGNLQLSSCLNPFFRMDGYWLAADLFGVADLRGRTIAYLEARLARWSGRPGPAVPFRPALALYAGLSIVFYIAVGAVMYFQVVWRIVPAFPGLLLSLGRAATIGAFVSTLTAVIWQALLIAACAATLMHTIAIVKRLARAVGLARGGAPTSNPPSRKEETDAAMHRSQRLSA